MENEPEMEREAGQPENAVEDGGQEREALIREIESGRATIAGLRQMLAVKDADIDALSLAVEEIRQALEAREQALSAAVAAYRELVLQANPGVLEEMITGGTVEEVNASLRNARALAQKVKRELEAEAARTRVPAGAPPRLPADTSALSAREKIQYALGGQ